jgi:YVTN family beta-propeller protein
MIENDSSRPPRVRIYRSRRPRRRRRLLLRRLLALGAVLVVAVAGIWGLARLVGDGDASSATERATAGKTPSARPSPRASATEAGTGSVSAAPSPSASGWTGRPSSELRLDHAKTIGGDISPKSVVSTGTGYVFAQNMMYRHTMTVYDSRTREVVKTIQDSIDAAAFGIKGHSGTLRGAPVEAAVLPDGRFMYVSQYSMYGDGFTRPGDDVCSPSMGIDDSFVYRVALDDLRVDKVIKVGAVPKYLDVTPDQRYLLVSNWCSYSLSVVDVHTSRQVKSVYLGPYPRGIAVDPESRYAYVAVMGSDDVARVDLRTFKLSWISGAGAGPRHLCMAPSGKYLYATLNAEGTVAKIDLQTRRVKDKVATGSYPRSMAIAPDGKSLYVVNYESNTLSKVRTSDMKVVQTEPTNSRPIGVTYDAPTRSVWVCCYTGSIMVFRER